MQNNNIYRLLEVGRIENTESWLKLYLNNGEQIEGQILDYDKDKILIFDGEYDLEEDVIVIPLSIITYFSCSPDYYGFESE